MTAKLKLSIIMICLIFISGCVNIPEEPKLKISNTEIRLGDSPTEDFKHVNLTFSDVKLYSNEAPTQQAAGYPNSSKVQ